MDSPVKYANNGDVRIAYRIFGAGPRDIVLVPGTASHLELMWEVPASEYMLSRLTSFARVIVFDKRGQGLSDRIAGTQTLEERIDDVRAVLDAAGSEQATVFGWSEGDPMSLLFGATHPQRVSSLVLLGTFASLENLADDAFEQFMRFTEATWGEGWGVYSFAPSRARDEAFVKWFARIERNTATPGAIVAIMRQSRQIDVRHLLPSVRVPTLILHRKGDTNVRVENGR
jgi:pimeloyl-ACP methyl ester carboxylesterase